MNAVARRFSLLLFFAWLFFSSCNPTKWLGKDQYLLTNNNIIYRPLQSAKTGKNKLSSISESEIAKLVLPPELEVTQLSNYIKQKPNTKILGFFPLHLYEYNLANPEKTKEKRVLKNLEIDAKNKKIEEENATRQKEGKKPKPYLSKEPKIFGEWLMNMGEAPVLLDSTLMEGSVNQLTKYLHTKGYFDCKVSDSVFTYKNNAIVNYIVRSGNPYKITSVKYEIDDSSLARIVYNDSINSLINKTENYDEDLLKSERERITRVLKNDGYYSFSKEYIDFEIDTNRTIKKVEVTIEIKKYAYINPLKPDSIIETQHQRYRIGNVTIQMNYNPNLPVYNAADTVKEKNYIIVSPKGEMSFLPKILLNKIFIKPHGIFNITDVENTYGDLSHTKEFKYINILWVEVKDSGKVDCYIQLLPISKLSFSAELVGDNTGGDWGGQADVSYQNNNLLKGAEVLQVKLKYSIQAQTLLGNELPTINLVSKSLLFNTQDIGPDISLTVPRALNLFKIIHVNPESAKPQTAFKVSYNYQVTPDYQREILTLGYGYDFNFAQHDHLNITPIEVNFVNAVNSQYFENYLNDTHDYFLLNSFTTHAITDFRLSWLYNNQPLTNKTGNFWYIKVSPEMSGLLMHLYDQSLQWISDHAQPDVNIGNPVQPDKIFGTSYSHYVKCDADIRHFWVISKDDKIAGRFIAGAGVPLYDDYGEQLPFDKSFWAGGSNDIRAWAARTLGPGANNQFVSVEQVGDIKLEANLEYRVNLIKFFGLAFFADAGNVWLLNNNPSIPHGNFQTDGPYAFYNEIAVGAGTGFRFDFTYFIFRLDLGWEISNPALHPESWYEVHETMQLRNPALNIGIGYPF